MDRRVIEDLGLPGVVLMELASHGVAASVRAHHHAAARAGVGVVCGPGNNGGDGWGAARWLATWGYPVWVWPIGEPRAGSDAAVMAAAARRAGVREVGAPEACGLWIDAVFGTGLTRDVTGDAAAALQRMDDDPAPVLAIDLPSGLEADSGRVLGVCPRATRTVTFGRPKLGMFCGDGPEVTGVIEVVDLGLDAGLATPWELAAAELPGAGDLAPSWPVRPETAHKGTSGHLLVVAGSAAMAGAAVLACRGALAGGAGLVTLAIPEGARPRLASLPPEVMVLDAGPGDRLAHLPENRRFDALVVGPGLGGGAPLAPGLAAELLALWVHDPRPVLFDADALACTGPATGPRVLTPHPGEAARLLGTSPADVEDDRPAAAQALTDRGVVLLKGRHTLIAARGASLSVNLTGGPALATGGSGDVLAGLIGALLARGVAARDAARLGAFVHGRAGERLGARRAEGWTAGSVADEVPDAVQELLGAAGAPGFP